MVHLARLIGTLILTQAPLQNDLGLLAPIQTIPVVLRLTVNVVLQRNNL